MEEENGYIDRRLAELERRIPAQYRVAVDDVVAEYIKSRTVEGHGWKWTDVEAACTNMIRQLHGRQRARQEEGRTWEGGGASDQELQEYSLFAQYVARIEQMPREQQDGHVEYRPLMRMDFDKLSRRRQVIELKN